MQTLSIKVSAKLFARAWLCTSTEQTRYYLCGVQIEPAPSGGAILVSTDGAKLLAIRDPAGHASGELASGAAGWIIQADPGALKALKARNAAFVTVTGDRLTVTDENDSPIYLQAAPCIVDGSFPDWRRVVPEMGDGARSTGHFDVRHVAVVAKALAADLYKSAEPLAMFADDPRNPALCFGSDPDLDGFGVVMPMRDGRSAASYVRPLWAERAAPKAEDTAAA